METTPDSKPKDVVGMMYVVIFLLVVVALLSATCSQEKETIHGELAVFHKDAYSNPPPAECMARNGADVTITDESGEVLWEDELYIVREGPIEVPSPACRLVFTSDRLPVTDETLSISLEGFDTQKLTWGELEANYEIVEWKEFISK